jgi:hypothetical protein
VQGVALGHSVIRSVDVGAVLKLFCQDELVHMGCIVERISRSAGGAGTLDTRRTARWDRRTEASREVDCLPQSISELEKSKKVQTVNTYSSWTSLRCRLANFVILSPRPDFLRTSIQ